MGLGHQPRREVSQLGGHGDGLAWQGLAGTCFGLGVDLEGALIAYEHLGDEERPVIERHTDADQCIRTDRFQVRAALGDNAVFFGRTESEGDG